ncbi:MAG TPA: alkaline phosphatase family protein [Thermoplasmata archaeon]|nr:alkaline phosphatase family protein [Thermoplasmata archaeon]
MLRATGHESKGDGPAVAAPLGADLDPTHGRRTEGPIVILLVDSLGWTAFRAATERRGFIERHPGLRAWAEAARPITTVFPSTTTAALTSLSVAAGPATHGIVGHRQYLPRWGLVADMLRMAPMTAPGSDTLIGPGWTRRELTDSPTVFELGVRTAVISRDRFQGTGFTRLLYEGAEYRPYSTASDLAEELTQVLSRDDPPEAVFVYWDELDTVHHVRGPHAHLAELELERLVGLISAAAGRLDPARARATSLWVTGDHGQVAAPESSNVALDRHPELLATLTLPPAGDRRAGFFVPRAGLREEFQRRLAPLLPTGTLFLEMERAIEEGLFGPPPYHPELRLRTGEVLVLPPKPAGMTYAAPGNPVPRRLFAGAHSGLEREELWVPLIAGPLSELAPG